MMATRERTRMALVFLGLPLVLYGMILRPSAVRHEALHQRIRGEDEACRNLPVFLKVTQEERAFLEAPDAAWRTRMPLVATDGARLALANRVVSDLAAALKRRGVAVAALRASWEPIQADFTLPAGLDRSPAPRPSGGDAPEYQLAGWALEVELPGATGQVFKALAALPELNPLLEPVGLRWELAGRGGKHRQYLILRAYYLKP
jgi:hypothetical protein